MKFAKQNYFFKSLLILIVVASAVSKDEQKPINIKVIPAKTNKLTLDDLDEIKMEILHDMNQQIIDLEDDMAEKERLREKTASTWSLTGAPIFVPRNPVAYTRASIMNNLEPTGNDSQNNVPYSHKLQGKIEELYNKINTPTNNIHIVYNHPKEDHKSSHHVIQNLQTKLEAADKAISDLKKLRNIEGKFATMNNLYTNGEKMINQATADNLMNPPMKFKQDKPNLAIETVNQNEHNSGTDIKRLIGKKSLSEKKSPLAITQPQAHHSMNEKEKEEFKNMFKKINSVNSGLKDVMKTQLDLVQKNFIHKKNSFSFRETNNLRPKLRKQNEQSATIRRNLEPVRQTIRDGPLLIENLIDN